MLCTSSVWKKFSGLNKLCKNNYFFETHNDQKQGICCKRATLSAAFALSECFRVGCCLLVLFFVVVVVCLCFFFCFSVHFTVLSCAINPLEEANNFS